MKKLRPAPRRYTKYQLVECETREYDRGAHDGYEKGYKKAKAESEDEIYCQERKAKLEMVKSLSLMIESTSRAVIAFVQEEGVIRRRG